MEEEFKLEPDGVEDWKQLWKGMPEFVQERTRPFTQITVRFETEADMINFAELVGSPITVKTKSIWYPHRSHFRDTKRIYVDEDDT